MNLNSYHGILAGETLTFVLTPRATWRLTGLDAERYLNGQVTNDVTSLLDGHAFYAAVCTAKGRMEGDVTIARHGAEFYLDADESLHESLGARIEKYLIADDALLEDVTGVWSVSHVFGLKRPESLENGFVIAHDRFGIPGHDVWIASSGGLVIGESVDPDLIETLRLENGLPRWGAELTPNTLPPEAGPRMLAAISYTKGCYVGQETIARLKSVGHVNRTLVFLRSDSQAFPPVGATLMLGEAEVGTVTSSGLSPRLDKGIALGYVQRQHASEGTILTAADINLTVSPSLLKTASP